MIKSPEAKARKAVRTNIYNAAHRKERAAYAKRYYAAHREEILVQKKTFLAAHREERKAQGKRYYDTHREERKAHSLTYFYAHREELNAYRRFHKYGLSQGAFNALLETQGRACAICRKTKWNGNGPHLDHDHTTGKVRGILCSNCNLVLGLIGNNPKIARKIGDYLELAETCEGED